jgi:hypothetical protein
MRPEVLAGRYFLRGDLVGKVQVEGVAFHFNDWVSSEDSPAPRRIEDFAMLPGGDVLLAAKSASGQTLCGRYSSEQGFRWSEEIPGSAPLIAATDHVAVLHTSSGWRIFSLR